MAEVTLSAGIRSNLVSLQNTNKLLSRTQERLSTGKTVNTAIDNPQNFFAAANLNDRATQLEARLDGMGQAVSTLQAADNSLTNMRGLVSALKAVVDEALSQPNASDRQASGKQFNELLVQLYNLARDSGYQGVNLLNSSESTATSGGTEKLTVQFHERFNVSTLEVRGVNVDATTDVQLDAAGEITTGSPMSSSGGQGWALSFNFTDETNAIGIRSAELTTDPQTPDISDTGLSHQISWLDGSTYRDNLKAITTQIDRFDQALVNTAKAISQNVNIVTLRQDFTSELVNVLREGADKMTLADLNEEGANLLALQTAQQLGTQSLAIASQANQAVLQLLG
jgi:flagellin